MLKDRGIKINKMIYELIISLNLFDAIIITCFIKERDSSLTVQCFDRAIPSLVLKTRV